MKYTQLRSFHAVAKVGSFTGAAKELNVSQPTISEQVRMLEATYGIEVFNRAQRNIKLTTTGRSLFEITQRLFGIVGEAEIFLRARKAQLGWDDESLPGTNASPFEALTIGAGGDAACWSFTSARVIRRRVRTSKGLMAAPSSAPTAARVTEDCIARRGMCALFPRRAPATGARFAPTA